MRTFVRFISSNYRVFPRVFLRVRVILDSVVFFVLSLYRRVACGSGARGLIKAPAGDRGLAPGCSRVGMYYPKFCSCQSPPLGGVQGGPHNVST